MIEEGAGVMHVDPEGRPVVEGPGSRGWAFFLAGLLILAVTYQILGQQEDVRILSGLVVGSLVAVVAWAIQLRRKRARWWRTSLVAGGSAVVVAPAVHLALGGDPGFAANVAAGWGVEAALLVAMGPAAGLHLIARGLGWGKSATTGERVVRPHDTSEVT